MITTILIDDEKHCNETLKIEITRHCPEIKILGDYTSGKEGIAAINALKPKLVFLDIEMPWMNGFEVLKQFDSVDFDVIFITAYDNYAIQAFRYSAVDYLLKPIQSDLLIEAVAKVARNKKHELPSMQLESLLYNLNDNISNSKVVFSTSDGLEIVDTSTIYRCQSDNNYTNVYMQNNAKLFLSKTLKEVELMLESNKFLRVHQSHLVNIDYVKKFVKADGGYLQMKNGDQVSVSKSKRDNLLTRLSEFKRV